MKLNVLDLKGKSIEEITLSKEVFGVTPNKPLVAQYLRVYMHNQRQGNSSTKTRAEVSGGGKKPWKQKHTGRARVGSSRNPIWRHGGISHGPKPKDWALDLPKKMKRLAMLSVLSSKFSAKELFVIEKLDLKEAKTKLVLELLTTLKLPLKTLIVTQDKNVKLLAASANVKGLNVAMVSNVNAYQIMKAKNVLFVKDALTSMEKKYENK